MKKKQKDNLIKAFEELGAPDKDVLLQKIESKKALGGNTENQRAQEKQRAVRVRRVAWTSFACSLAVIALVIVIIASSVFGRDGSGDGPGAGIGADVKDYRSSWSFTFDDNISFDQTDKTIKDAGIDLVFDFSDDWTIVKTQVTQDESAYREYYVKDGVKVEFTLLLSEKVTSMDGRYYAILNTRSYSFIYDKYIVYRSYYVINGISKHAYSIFLEDQVYIFTSDVDLMELGE